MGGHRCAGELWDNARPGSGRAAGAALSAHHQAPGWRRRGGRDDLHRCGRAAAGRGAGGTGVPSGQIVAEEYVVGREVTAVYVIKDGVISFVCLRIAIPPGSMSGSHPSMTCR